MQSESHSHSARSTSIELSPSGAEAVRIDAAGATDVGRVRAANEDAYLIATLQRSIIVHAASPAASGWFAGEPAGTLLVVADGMGGQGGGDVASRVAVTAVVNHLLNCMPWGAISATPPKAHSPSLPGVRDELSDALVAGDERVKTAGAETGTPRMGTTLTLALVLWPMLYVAHVGDTRCYLQRGGKLECLTTDHTMAQRMADASAHEVDPGSHLHHILWNSLGASEELPQPEITRVDLQAGDVLLLCSDGLCKYIDDAQIAAILNTGESSATRAQQLIDCANAAGGADNITAVVAQATRG
ncbi:MAG TPA: protein phosphatase 2C domain-containing protein [Polyangiaceae bacterium]|nr:protein phosphatase 2C domain-containing protein [Polyangiaceae bacterium]